MTTGVILFDDAEELDFAGPWEVFTSAAMLKGGGRVVTIAEHDRPVRCAKGLRVLPDHGFADAPPLDVLVVPGGIGTRREEDNPAMLDFLRRAAAGATWVTSVCTGSALLAAAGLARGKRITSHWSYLDTLRARDDVTVLEKRRWVRDGNLVTSAGVSAGIDMALWLVGAIEGPDFARTVQHWIEYDPAPPFAAEV
jgi:transcriptional regulator GlxA family with amidase domain